MSEITRIYPQEISEQPKVGGSFCRISDRLRELVTPGRITQTALNYLVVDRVTHKWKMTGSKGIFTRLIIATALKSTEDAALSLGRRSCEAATRIYLDLNH